jgi:hypothetical protein
MVMGRHIALELGHAVHRELVWLVTSVQSLAVQLVLN